VKGGEGLGVVRRQVPVISLLVQPLGIIGELISLPLAGTQVRTQKAEPDNSPFQLLLPPSPPRTPRPRSVGDHFVLDVDHQGNFALLRGREGKAAWLLLVRFSLPDRFPPVGTAGQDADMLETKEGLIPFAYVFRLGDALDSRP